MRKLLGLVVVTLVPAAVRLAAHHAFAAEFDVNQPVKVHGTGGLFFGLAISSDPMYHGYNWYI